TLARLDIAWRSNESAEQPICLDQQDCGFEEADELDRECSHSSVHWSGTAGQQPGGIFPGSGSRRSATATARVLPRRKREIEAPGGAISHLRTECSRRGCCRTHAI